MSGLFFSAFPSVSVASTTFACLFFFFFFKDRKALLL